MNNGYQDTPMTAEQAEAFLRSRKEGNIKLYEKKDGKMHVDHASTANAMVMFIANVPMDKWIKKIMIMRIGAPLLNKAAMSHMQIALRLGMLEKEVQEIEAEGIRICNEFMDRCTGKMVAMPGNKSFINDSLNITKE